jgi:hypothetical protein
MHKLLLRPSAAKMIHVNNTIMNLGLAQVNLKVKKTDSDFVQLVRVVGLKETSLLKQARILRCLRCKLEILAFIIYMLLVRSQWLCLNKILFKEASLNKWMLDS